MAATDARPVPRKNAAFRFYFSVRKNDGTLITGWTGADSEVSIDGASFSDCTNEATEIGATGCGYIDLTSSEMNGDAVVYKLTVTNTGALPLVVTFFPEEAGDYRADITHFGGTAGTFSGGRPEVNTTHAAGTAWNSGAIGAATFAADAITAAKIAADVGTEIATAVWGALTSALTTVGSVGKLIVDYLDAAVSSRSTYAGGDTAGTTTLLSRVDVVLSTRMAASSYSAPPTAVAIADQVWDEVLSGHATAGTTGAALSAAGGSGDPWATDLPGAYSAGSAGYLIGTYINASLSAIKAKTDNLPVDPADASDIAASFSSITTLINTLTGYVDTEVAAIKAKTDNLPTDPADASDIAASFSSITTLINTLTGYVDTEVAAIKAKTDALPADPADASDIAASFASISSSISTLTAYVDTEVAAIKAKTDQLTFTVANQADVNVRSANGYSVTGDGTPGNEWGPV